LLGPFEAFQLHVDAKFVESSTFVLLRNT
jgi:hypothetical protein